MHINHALRYISSGMQGPGQVPCQPPNIILVAGKRSTNWSERNIPVTYKSIDTLGFSSRAQGMQFISDSYDRL